jgi:hypothetical protein
MMAIAEAKAMGMIPESYTYTVLKGRILFSRSRKKRSK